MSRDRLIQAMALVVMLVSTTVCGALLPSLIDLSEKHALRYTDVSVEGAPPFVALGTTIGALRGIIVDYLWIKVNIMQQKGLFYEVMADADLITSLQPRFAAVWAFHGHNMAYNISVATHTEEERWEWVKSGIRLVRNEGLRHNPNDLVLHKELAFWYAHKIEGVSDDAHLYYKQEFGREWHFLLGVPPDDYQERTEWIEVVANAPETLEAAERRTPGVMALVERLQEQLTPHQQRFKFALDARFLRAYGEWKEIRGASRYVKLLGLESKAQSDAFFRTFDELASDPQVQEVWPTLIAHVRKRVLKDEYNMDPQLMYEYTRDLGPIDWRHGQAHALYWSRRGEQFAELRVAKDDIYKIVNNDRLQLQAMQGLARFGRISFDPFSDELPSRFPDPRWIDAIEREFPRFYEKHYLTRGAGGDTFVGFFKNFLSSAVREWYRAGEIERAQKLLDRLDDLFGDTIFHDPSYRIPVDIFVRKQTFDEYQFQPHMAPSEVAASLRLAYLVGVAQNRPEVTQRAIGFAKEVTEYFKGNEYSNFVNKFGVQRIGDIIDRLERSAVDVLGFLMIDRTVPLLDRMTVWAGVDEVGPELRGRVYDRVKPVIEHELQTRQIGAVLSIDQVLPAPANLEVVRVIMEAERRARGAERPVERDPLRRR